MALLKIRHKTINIAQEDHYELKIINLDLNAEQQNKILDACKLGITEVGGIIREQWLPIPRGVKLERLPLDANLPIHKCIRPNFDAVLGMILFTLPCEEVDVETVVEELVPEAYRKHVFVQFLEASGDSDHDDQWKLNDPLFIARWFNMERKHADSPWLRKYQDFKYKRGDIM